MPAVGDQIELAATKVGQVPRRGVVTDVRGNMLRVRWPSGEESSLVPGPGTLSVVGRTRGALGSPKATGRAAKRVTTATPALASKTSKRLAGTKASTRNSPKKAPVTTKAAAKATTKRSTKKTVAKAPVPKTAKRPTTPKRTAPKKAPGKRGR